MEVYLNFPGINDDIKSDIQKIEEKLEEASNLVSSAKIPSDFSSTSIRNVTTKISNMKQQLKQFQNWLNNSVSKFKEAESQNESIIESLMSNIESAGNKLENITKYESIDEKVNEALNQLETENLINGEQKSKLTSMLSSRMNEYANMSIDQIKEDVFNMLHPEIRTTQRINEALDQLETENEINGEAKTKYTSMLKSRIDEFLGMTTDQIKQEIYYIIHPEIRTTQRINEALDQLETENEINGEAKTKYTSMLEAKINEFSGMTTEQIKQEIYYIIHPEVLTEKNINQAMDKLLNDGIITNDNFAQVESDLKEKQNEFTGMSAEQIYSAYLNTMLNEGTLNMQQFYEVFSNTDSFGVTQISEISDEAIDFVANKFNISKEQAKESLTNNNSTYTATCANIIFAKFKNSPEEFEKIYGFPMYKQTENGDVFNDKLMWLLCGVQGSSAYNNSKQSLMTKVMYSGADEWIRNEESTGEWLIATMNLKYYCDHVEPLMQEYNSGKIMILKTTQPYNCKDLKTGEVLLSDNRELIVTGVTNEGFIVSDDGRECLILFNNIKEDEYASLMGVHEKSE